MTSWLLFVFVLVVAGTIFFRRFRLKGKNELAAVRVYCEAGGEFTNWRIRNPGVYIGLSMERRRLLAHYIEAYDEFLRTHKYISDNGHRAFLVSFFNDLPPKTPRRKRIPKQQSIAA